MTRRLRLLAIAVFSAGLTAHVAAQEPKLRVTLEGHKSPVLSVAFSPDGQTLATGGFDRAVKLWDVPHRKSEK